MPAADRARPAAPNMPDYERARACFSWERAAEELDWLPGGALNIAHEAVDRHASGPLAGTIALRLIARDGRAHELTYAQLARESDRFANVLAGLGAGRTERVFALAGRIAELYVGALGALKNGSVFCPLFSAFGPEPIEQRLRLGDGRVLITTTTLFARKLAPVLPSLPGLAHVLLVGEPERIAELAAASSGAGARAGSGAATAGVGGVARISDLHALMDAAAEDHEIAATDPEEAALLHFTSGTTGTPKGAVHVHRAVVAHHATGRLVLDLRPGDIFWCTADPGWVTGTSYGIVSPLSNGVTSIVDEADFDAERWYRILQDQRVSVWYTAPTALRRLMRAGTQLAREHDLSALRFIASVGEPLNPEVVTWGREAFGMPIHENWWQTETGGIMVANYRSMPVRPGSMGRPLPGVQAAVARRDERGRVLHAPDGSLQLADAGQSGELVLRPGWPSMFRDYLGEHARYERCFSGGWYLTGDLVRADADGYLWFVGRGDDVIKSSGHLIGPFEVESALLEHPAVAEVGVIGRPDEVAGEVVKAFVAPGEGVEPSAELRRELVGFARSRLGADLAPREIEFVGQIPRNRSGKIMRRVLKARELGLPEGDLSTLEPAG